MPYQVYPNIPLLSLFLLYTVIEYGSVHYTDCKSNELLKDHNNNKQN